MPHFSVTNPYLIKFTAPLTGADGVLRGKKVAVKDLFHMAGIATSAGNPDWLHSHPLPTQTSPVISALRNQGASIVGKTITDELAYSLNGQNIHYGTPINTKNPSLLPGGSSSGSAIAVADSSADIGLGTDTGGSIRVPASYNGLFGLRPTHGVVSTEQLVGLAPSFDTVGWITRDLATLAAVAKVLLPQQTNIRSNKQLNIGFSQALNETCQHHTQIVLVLEKLSHSSAVSVSNISERLNFPALEAAAEAFKILQGAEIWATHGEWILDQQPIFAPDIAQRFNWCKTINTAQVATAKGTQNDFCELVTSIFKQVDYILLPTTPGSAPALSADVQQLNDYRNQLLTMTCIAGLAGLPQIQIPLYQADKAPVGLSIIGPKHSDLQLIHFAQNLLETIK